MYPNQNRASFPQPNTDENNQYYSSNYMQHQMTPANIGAPNNSVFSQMSHFSAPTSK